MKEKSSQRDTMRALYKELGGIETAIVIAYAKAEADGRVSRKSNSTALSAEDYARALLSDGLRKGWLK